MPKLKSRLSTTNSRSAKAVLAVLLATMLSAGSAYANPDQPPTDPSGGTASDSASQPASDDAGLSGSAVNGTINLPRVGSIGDGAFDGSKAGTGPVCTRHAEAITSAATSLDAIHRAGTSILERQEDIGAQLEAVDASDPADIARSQADTERIYAEMVSTIRDVREMMQDVEQARAQTNEAIARNN